VSTAADRPGTTKPLAVIIIGADALLAARPATAIQLWHGCLAAGYDLPVPATWGDELIAAESLRALTSHPTPVAVMCSCPLVARTVGRFEENVGSHLISLVAPPVATARYIRRVHGERRVHITFVGACPSGADSAIDAWIMPNELFDRFEAGGIALGAQPELFESVIPPDRRRHLSQPGGLPTSERAATMPRPRLVHEIDDDDVIGAVARHLRGSVRSLLDFAPRAGCVCSGATAGVAPNEARALVTVLEPPRSARPVMGDPAGLALTRRLPAQMWPREESTTLERGQGDRGELPSRATRPSAVASHATRSPLSWNLRERVLPQPPATARPLTVPEVASPATREVQAADADAAALAAARALEASAARMIHRVIAKPVVARVPTAPGLRSAGEARIAARADIPQAEAPAPASPGRYWFAAKPAVVTREGDSPPYGEPQWTGEERRRQHEHIEEGIAYAGDDAMVLAENRAFAVETEKGDAWERMLTAESDAYAAASRARRPPAAGSPIAAAERAPASAGIVSLDLRALRERATAVRELLDRPGHALVAAVVIVLLVVLLLITAANGDDTVVPTASRAAPGQPPADSGGAGGAGEAASATGTIGRGRATALSTGVEAQRRSGAGGGGRAALRGAAGAPPASVTPRPAISAPRADTAAPTQGRGIAARDSVIADSIARAAAARTAELDSMRAELLRSRARIDSLARANSVLVIPRPPGTPPPGTPPPPIPPAPASGP
jgi:hypothetical protein